MGRLITADHGCIEITIPVTVVRQIDVHLVTVYGTVIVVTTRRVSSASLTVVVRRFASAKTTTIATLPTTGAVTVAPQAVTAYETIVLAVPRSNNVLLVHIGMCLNVPLMPTLLMLLVFGMVLTLVLV